MRDPRTSSMLWISAFLLVGTSLTLMSSSHGAAAPSLTHQTHYFLYVGTYGRGVYGFRYDTKGGTLEPMGLTGEVVNPSFLATDPHFRTLYAASEIEGPVNGEVVAFAIDRKTGSLKLMNKLSSEGTSPCHLTTDRTAKMLMVANYGSGGVIAYPLQHDGSLGARSALMTEHGSSVNPSRQKGPHAHEVVVSPDNRFLYVPDLGLDRIRIYRIDAATAKLTPADPPFAKVDAGLGPRHIAFTPNHKFAYVANELKPIVTAFSVDASTGNLTQIQNISTLPPGHTGEAAQAEIEVDPAGKFVYASNRGPGTIAVLAIDQSKGTLQEVEFAPSGGSTPRGFTIDPSGNYLLAGDQKGDQFSVFARNPDTGKLTSTGRSYKVPSPVDFLFVPAE